MRKVIDYFEAQELACAALDLDYDTLVDDGREEEIENALYEKFEISMDQFQDIASILLPLTPPISGGISNTVYNAFGKEDKDMGCWVAICKTPIKDKQ